MNAPELGVVEEKGAPKGVTQEGVDRLVALGRALSDPMRVRMLSMMAEGRGCCDFSGSGVPAEQGEAGICICEFEEVFGMGQSKISSQMAEGLLRHLAGDRFEVHSAGTEATRVRPLAARAMEEVGVDISGHESKTLDRYLQEPFDYVITVCDDANEAVREVAEGASRTSSRNSRSKEQTSSAAESVKPPAKTARLRNRTLSSRPSRSWLQSIVARRVLWRGIAVLRPPESSRNRSSRRAKI